MSIRVLERALVSPPKDSVRDTMIPLSSLDIIWQLAGSVERLFFFKTPHSTSHFIHRIVPHLKSSLALTLQHFYPLAGHVRFDCQSDHRFELHYKDGDSVAFTVAESDDDFDHLSGNDERDYGRLQPLIPNSVSSFKTDPLMALQATLFPNHGICVGITISHAASDGTSTMNFIRAWAATCRSGATAAVVVDPPLFDRNLLTIPSDLNSSCVENMLKFKEQWEQISSQETTQNDVVFVTLALGREEIEKLKQRILAKYEQGEVPYHLSTFVVACAYVWTCLIRSRRWPSDKSAYISFAVDARARLKPPVPKAYFGNCIGVCGAEVKVSDVVEPAGSVHCAAEAVGKAIDGLKEGVLQVMGKWLQAFGEMVDVRPLSIAGSPRFKVYDTDFGWGRPIKVEVTSIRKTGAISLAEAKGEEQGGIEIGLGLPKPEMDEFTALFAGALGVL